MGSVAHCEMLYRTNMLAVVAGGYRPKFANNTVLVYDDREKKFVLELVFPSQVKAVRMRRDKLVFALIMFILFIYKRKSYLFFITMFYYQLMFKINSTN